MSKKMVNIKINNVPLEVEEGTTILDAATQAGYHIPTLCFLRNYNETGSCRVCVVEIKGRRNLAASCIFPVYEGLEVFTNTEKVLEARRKNVELLLSNHSKDCLGCIRNQNCELQKVTEEVGVRENRYHGAMSKPTYDDVAPGIVRDTSKCILCGRCIEICKKVQGVGILDFMNRGFETKVGPVYDMSFADVDCMQCGQCVINCPVGALSEKEEIHEVVNALNDPNKFVIVQTAPAVRASLGEEFGNPIGTRVTGKMVAALRRIGFNRVFDTNFGADLTIMEEGTEFINRLQNKGVLPMITSCSPGWIRYAEFEYPDLLDHLSSCKSPHMMLGAICKSYFAKINNLDPKDIYVVSIMPCTAKKSEAVRSEMRDVHGNRDVDAVLTTRECGRLIKMYGIDFNGLPDEKFDQDLLGEYTGAAVIFGATGGVMEAALRTVKDVLEGKSFENVDYKKVRGMEGVKEASLTIKGKKINVCVTSSMHNAKPILEEIRAGKSKYHFIEIMGCPGGCINGGGQSIVSARIKNSGVDYQTLRAKCLYDEDSSLPKRKSHENQQVKDLYKNYLGEPNSHLAHELLHTTYHKRERFNVRLK